MREAALLLLISLATGLTALVGVFDLWTGYYVLGVAMIICATCSCFAIYDWWQP